MLGALAGYIGGTVDEVIMRLTDLVFAFPTIILAMVVAAALGPSLQNAVFALIFVIVAHLRPRDPGSGARRRGARTT